MLERPDADTVLRELAGRGVATHRSYFPPLYRHPNFVTLAVGEVIGDVLPATADIERKQARMVNSERMLARIVGVPFHSFMSEADVAAVVAEVKRKVCDT
jgi:dTDP-4-amino-4,6-dideoxygalactose transaminase